MKLREIAYAREGDKGDIANICVFPYNEADWPRMRKALTEDAVRQKFADLVKGTVTRYEYPNLPGLNFVLTEALSGGVSLSLRQDGHGKTYASLLLDLDI